MSVSFSNNIEFNIQKDIFYDFFGDQPTGIKPLYEMYIVTISFISLKHGIHFKLRHLQI